MCGSTLIVAMSSSDWCVAPSGPTVMPQCDAQILTGTRAVGDRLSDLVEGPSRGEFSVGRGERDLAGDGQPDRGAHHILARHADRDEPVREFLREQVCADRSVTSPPRTTTLGLLAELDEHFAESESGGFEFARLKFRHAFTPASATVGRPGGLPGPSPLPFKFDEVAEFGGGQFAQRLLRSAPRSADCHATCSCLP